MLETEYRSEHEFELNGRELRSLSGYGSLFDIPDRLHSRDSYSTRVVYSCHEAPFFGKNEAREWLEVYIDGEEVYSGDIPDNTWKNIGRALGEEEPESGEIDPEKTTESSPRTPADD